MELIPPTSTHAPQSPTGHPKLPDPKQPTDHRSRLFHKERKLIYINKACCLLQSKSTINLLPCIRRRKALHGIVEPKDRTKRVQFSHSQDGPASASPGNLSETQILGLWENAEQVAVSSPGQQHSCTSGNCNYFETLVCPRIATSREELANFRSQHSSSLHTT